MKKNWNWNQWLKLRDGGNFYLPFLILTETLRLGHLCAIIDHHHDPRMYTDRLHALFVYSNKNSAVAVIADYTDYDVGGGLRYTGKRSNRGFGLSVTSWRTAGKSTDFYLYAINRNPWVRRRLPLRTIRFRPNGSLLLTEFMNAPKLSRVPAYSLRPVAHGYFSRNFNGL